MDPQALAALTAGGFALSGTLAGVSLSTWFARRAEADRLREEDARRWLSDRRTTYAVFLVLAESMLREIDGVAVFLSYDGTKAIPAEDEALRSDGLTTYLMRWDDELQPALVDVQLLAGAKVADLADRAAGALMELTAVIETKGAFTEFHPQWFKARDLLGVLRNAMRRELGLLDAVDAELPRSGDWPWLSERPTEEEYIRRQTAIPGRHHLTEGEERRLHGESVKP